MIRQIKRNNLDAVMGHPLDVSVGEVRHVQCLCVIIGQDDDLLRTVYSLPL